jgi:glutaredoxin
MKTKTKRSTRHSNDKSRTKRGYSHGNGFHLPKEGRITVYGKSTCPWCQKMKQQLKLKHDVYVDITPHLIPAFNKYIVPRIRGQQTIPIVFVGTKFIGGHDDYMKYIGKQ